MRKNLSFLTKIPLAIASFTALFGVLAFASADFLSVGRLVQGTPFDGRMRSAGCFNLMPNKFVLENRRSIEELFAVARSFRYVGDLDGDSWQSAEETEARHAGDCEDKAIWLFARLTQNGYYNVLLTVGWYRRFDERLHVWVVCSDKNGNVYLLDPSMQKRIWSLTAIDSGFYKPVYAYDGTNKYQY